MSRLYTFIKIFCLAAFLFPCAVFAQPSSDMVGDVILPPPNAASIGKYGDIPVSHSTGIPNITIPIHTVVDGPLSMPISVSYHGSGIRVNEVATWVGLGWNLNAGGMISRTIMGAPDESTRGYYNYGDDLTEDEYNICLFHDDLNDGEPDMFNVSYPGGGFKFFFDGSSSSSDKVRIVQKETDAKIEFYSQGGFLFGEFIVTTSSGTKFYFGMDQNNNTPVRETMTTQTAGQSWLSSWLLTRMESQDGNYYIDFNYVNENYSYQNLSSCTFTDNSESTGALVPVCVSSGVGLPDRASTEFQVTSGKRLSTITNSSGTETITFVAGNQRADVEGTANELGSIKCQTGTYCKEFDFQYGRFFDYLNYQSENNHTFFKRLRLDGIQEKSCNGTITIPAHEFTYHGAVQNGDTYMPHRLSKAVDHWGYYNGKHNNESLATIIPRTTVDHPVPGNNSTYTYPALGSSAADRDTDEASMLIGSLKKITYPTGGNTEFTFEANTVKEEVEGAPVSVLNMATCGTPTTACCGVKFSNQTVSFTNVSDPFVFDMDVVRVFPWGACTGGWNSPEFTDVTLEVLEGSTVIGGYQFNVNPGQGNAAVLNKPLADIMYGNWSGFTAGTSYQFILTSINGRGAFNLKQLESEITSVKVGGLRIKELKTHDNESTSNDIIKTFDYLESSGGETSGILINKPIYGSSYAYDIADIQITNTGALIVSNEVHTNFQFGSVTAVPLSGYDGRNVVYSRVVENQNGNGKIERDFYISNDQPDISILKNELGIGSWYPSQIVTGPAALYFPKRFDATSGQLSNEKIYNSSNEVVSERSITYASPEYVAVEGEVMKVDLHVCIDNGSIYHQIRYVINESYKPRSGALLILNETSTLDGVSTTTEYEYSTADGHHNPTQITTTHSDDSETRIVTQYPVDFSPAGNTPLGALMDRNIITPVKTMQQIKHNGTWVDIAGNHMIYGKFNESNGLLNNNASSGFDVYMNSMQNYNRTWDGTTLLSGSWETEGVINSYHSASSPGKGYPKQFTKLNWDPETYEWENGSIKKRTFKDFVWEYFYEPNTKMVNKIRDIDGQEVLYTYDALKRLKTTSARGGKLTSTYTYAYHGAGNPKNAVKVDQHFGTVADTTFFNLMTNQYLDGLGRSVQTVKKQYSPDSKDVVSHIIYDNQGRPSKQYTPFEQGQTSGNYVANPPAGQAYTLTEYYASPLNRTEKVTPPDWLFPTLYDYGSNTSTITVPGGGPSYSAGNLFKTIITDPNGNKTYSFTDSRGRNILTRKSNNPESITTDTYNVYDEKNRLITVVPPGATLSSLNLIYNYSYDGENQVISKKVPDAAEMIMKYDNRDLLVLSRDGNLTASNQWNATTYDPYGRPTTTGLISDSNPNPNSFLISNPLTQTGYDGKNSDGSTYSTAAIYLGKVRETKVKALDSGSGWTEMYNQLTYDSYGRTTNAYANHHMNTGPSTQYDEFIYDYADNVIFNYSRHADDNNTDYENRYRTNYDHSGRVVSQQHKYGNTALYTYLSTPTYNYRDEMETNKIGGSSIGGVYKYLQQLDYTYNEQGWLETINSSNLGGGSSVLNACASTGIVNPSSSSNFLSNDLFHLDLKYAELQPNLPGTIQKNGNISQAIWRVRGRERQSYSYTYDHLDRITSATYKDIRENNTPASFNYYGTNYSYDDRGNIQSLQRSAPVDFGWFGCVGGTIDNLSYTYLPGTNKLRKVTDSAPSANRSKGFTPGSTSNFQYDANGNATYDPNKQVTISYNHLNLPHNFNFGGGKEIDIVYDASGVKLRKTVKQSGTVQYTQDYVRGIEYRNDRMESFPITGGRLYNTSVNTSSTAVTPRYEYSITDHLGNARVMFADKDNDGRIDFSSSGAANEILNESHYYPFGMEMDGPWVDNFGNQNDNQYLYNGKELNDDFGLDWYHYEMRWYDPSVARFHSVDPIIENFPSHTPYNYAFQNPVTLIDLYGLQGVNPNGFLHGGGSSSGVKPAKVGKPNMFTRAKNYLIAKAKSAGTAISNFYQGGAREPLKRTVSGAVEGFMESSGYVEGKTMTGNTTEAAFYNATHGAADNLPEMAGEGAALLLEYAGGAGEAMSAAKSGGKVLKSFDDIAQNATEIAGKSAAEIGEILGEGWTKGKLNSGDGWKYTQDGGDGFVSFTTGNSQHPGSSYYKVNSGKYGKQKVVGRGYKGNANEKSTIHVANW